MASFPIEEFGFPLHKRAFQDAIALRYNWTPLQSPTFGCGTKFSIDHALSWPKGGLPSIRHNEIRDLTANLLSEVCSDIQIEPNLQHPTGEILILKTVHGWMSRLMASGMDTTSGHTLMSKSSTLMLCPTDYWKQEAI